MLHPPSGNILLDLFVPVVRLESYIAVVSVEGTPGIFRRFPAEPLRTSAVGCREKTCRSDDRAVLLGTLQGDEKSWHAGVTHVVLRLRNRFDPIVGSSNRLLGCEIIATFASSSLKNGAVEHRGLGSARARADQLRPDGKRRSERHVRRLSDQVVGAVQTVVASPTNPDILFIGTVNGGICGTENATAANPTWTPLTDNASSLSSACSPSILVRSDRPNPLWRAAAHWATLLGPAARRPAFSARPTATPPGPSLAAAACWPERTASASPKSATPSSSWSIMPRRAAIPTLEFTAAPTTAPPSSKSPARRCAYRPARRNRLRLGRRSGQHEHHVHGGSRRRHLRRPQRHLQVLPRPAMRGQRSARRRSTPF